MSLTEDLNNPNLFQENEPGEYSYDQDGFGKTARGQLTLDSPAVRDVNAQRNAGGQERRDTDEGGHLIGIRYGGDPGKVNLSAQDRNLNRQDYKNLENEWADMLKDGNTKVFVNIETYDPNSSDRPFNYQGYYIVERSDENGNTIRTWDTFSFNNESRTEMGKINEEAEQYLIGDEHDKTAQFHWDEEKGELVENPYFEPDPANAEKSAHHDVAVKESNFGVPTETDLGKDSTKENAADYGEPAKENGDTQNNDTGVNYTCEGEQSNEVGTENGPGSGEDNGNDNGGQDMD